MSQICYAPNAVPVPEYGPCNNSTDSISLCCSPGQFCLTNGLCANGEGEFYSGACTDKTYKAAICPSFCMGASKFVVQCQHGVIPDGGFCCDANGSGTCCNSANNVLDLAKAVTSATVAPTTITGGIASTLSLQTPPSSSISASRTVSSSIFSAGSMISSGTSSPGSTFVTDTTSTRSISSTTTATLVPVSRSVSTMSNKNGRNIALAVVFGVLGLIAFLILMRLSYRWWRRKHATPKGRIVENNTSEIKVEPIELGTMGLGPAELDSPSTTRAPMAAPGLNASRVNLVPLSWMPGEAEFDRRSPVTTPGAPALRPNNPQGPLPFSELSIRLNDLSRDPRPAPGSAITQTDGASTPPPTQDGASAPPSTEDGNDSNAIELLDDSSEQTGQTAAVYAPSDVEGSDIRAPTDGIIVPPNSEEMSSVHVNSSTSSTKSWASDIETVLDVGCALNTAETESEQGHVSPTSATSDSFEDGELSQYLRHVGWSPEQLRSPVATGLPAPVESEADGHANPGQQLVPVASDLPVAGDVEAGSFGVADSDAGNSTATHSDSRPSTVDNPDTRESSIQSADEHFNILTLLPHGPTLGKVRTGFSAPAKMSGN